MGFLEAEEEKWYNNTKQECTTAIKEFLMRTKKSIRKSIFILYISFLLVLLLLFIPFSRLSFQSLREQGVNASQETLSTGMQRLERELDNIYQIAHALYTSKNYPALSKLSPGQAEPLSNDVPKLITLQKEYKTYDSMLALTDDLGLILPNGAVLASGRIHMPSESFYGNYFQAEGFSDLSAWTAFIRQGQPGMLLSQMAIARYDTGLQKYIVAAMPVPLSRANASTFCYALLNEEKVANALILSTVAENSALTLTDAQGKILLEQPLDPEENYVLIAASSQKYGVTAQLSIEESYFMYRFDGFYRLFGWFVAAYMLVGVLLALIFTHQNAKPIVKMVSAATEVSRDEELQNDSAQQNAYAFMDSFIQKVDSRLKENRLALANQEILLKENLMERLLRGQLYMSSSFERARRYFPDFPSPCQMARINLGGDGLWDPQALSQMQMEMQKIVREQVSPQAMLHFSGDILIVLQPAEENLRLRYEQLLEKLEQTFDLQPYITLSRPFEKLDELSSVFARLRLMRRFSPGKTSLLVEDQEAAVLPYAGTQHISQFNESLTRAQLKPALNALDAELKAFQSGGYMDENGVQQLFFTYRHILCQAAKYANISLEEAQVPGYDPTASLDQLFEAIRQSAGAINRALESKIYPRITEKEQKVLDVIAEHLGNPDLSTEFMTSLLSVSDKTLQRTMRNATGMTFYEYIHSCRMEKARQLLTETDLPIQDVSVSCGYTSINSFYKAFQRTFAIAPNAMRKNAQEENEK